MYLPVEEAAWWPTNQINVVSANTTQHVRFGERPTILMPLSAQDDLDDILYPSDSEDNPEDQDDDMPDFISDDDLPPMVSSSEDEPSDHEDPDEVSIPTEAPALEGNFPFLVISEDAWIRLELTPEPDFGEPPNPITQQLLDHQPNFISGTCPPSYLACCPRWRA